MAFPLLPRYYRAPAIEVANGAGVALEGAHPAVTEPVARRRSVIAETRIPHGAIVVVGARAEKVSVLPVNTVARTVRQAGEVSREIGPEQQDTTYQYTNATFRKRFIRPPLFCDEVRGQPPMPAGRRLLSVTWLPGCSQPRRGSP